VLLRRAGWQERELADVGPAQHLRQVDPAVEQHVQQSLFRFEAERLWNGRLGHVRVHQQHGTVYLQGDADRKIDRAERLAFPASALVTSTRLAGAPALDLATFARICRLMRRKPSAIGVRSPSGVIMRCRRNCSRPTLRVRVVRLVGPAGLALAFDSTARPLASGRAASFWLQETGALDALADCPFDRV